MILYLLRHGIALDRADWKRADGERPLTKDGARKMNRTARGMRKLGIAFDALLTSPYRRAYDTARIVAKEYGVQKELRISRSLASDGDPKALVRHLALDFRSRDKVMLVGHEPYLSRLVGVLVGGSPDIAIDLKKGGLCRLSADSLTFGACARLEWLLTSKLLRQFA